MHFTTSAAVGLLAASAVATAFEFPANVPMSKRQTEGPSYECHANCGYAIKDATGEYCKNDKWLGLLKGCLACANEFDIWQYYGNKVGAAAKACGLDATPKPAGNGGSSSAVAASSAPASSAPAASEAVSTPAASTPAATHASGTPVAQSSAAQTVVGSSSAASAASSGHPAASSSAGHSNTTTVVTGGAEKKQVGLVMAAGVLAAAWM